MGQRKMEKGNPQLPFVSLKSVKVRGTEGNTELKSDVSNFQNTLTCEECKLEWQCALQLPWLSAEKNKALCRLGRQTAV
jgi:hypothetical protein